MQSWTSRAKQDPSVALKGGLSSPGRKRGHVAMARDELPKLLEALEVYNGDRRTSIALRLIILTFVRTSELRAARWSEFEGLDRDDFLLAHSGRTDENEKGSTLFHLPRRSWDRRAIYGASPGSDLSPYLFPSPATEGFMSNNTMLYALYRMGYHGRATVHGLPSAGLDRTQRNGLSAGRHRAPACP